MMRIGFILFSHFVLLSNVGICWERNVSWQATGLYGGSIMQILRHPDGSLVANCKYRSIDEGYTWVQIPGGGSPTFSILPDGTLFQPMGLSSDWGNTWTPIGYAGGGRGHIQAVGSDFAGNLYIASRTGYASNGIFFRSTDRGQHWATLWSSDSRNGFVQNIVVSPHGDIYAGGGSGGLSYSTDSGKTWTGMDWGSGWCSVTPTMTRGEVFMGTDWGYIARSTEYGSWVMSRTPIAGDATIYTFCFTNDSTEVLAGTSAGVYVSTDRGLTWAKRSEELDFPTVYTLKTLENGDILAGTYTGGILRSTDRGRTWRASNTGCTGMGVGNLTVSPTGELYVSSSGSLFHSTDHGESWQLINSDVPGRGTISVPWAKFGISSIACDHRGNIYFGTPPILESRSDTLRESYLYFSSNQGGTWARLNYDIGAPEYPGSYLVSIAVKRDGTIFVADKYTGIFRSTDNGDSWEPVWHASLDSSWIIVQKVIVSGSGLLIAGLNKGVMTSTDNGNSWVQGEKGFPADDLAEGPDGALYVAVSSGGVFKSEDYGATWTQSPEFIYERDGARATCTSVGVSARGMIFAGTIHKGIAISTDRGTTWQSANEGLQTTYETFYDITFDSTGYVYATSLSSSVIRSVNPLTGIEAQDDDAIPSSFFLSPPFPNPFNPSTTISYSLPRAEHVSLSIYDVLGREIVTLVNEKREAGSYQVTWNASNSPSGIYLCRMRAGEYGETRKLLLLR